MEFYQFPLFSFLLLPSYIFLPRFRGKDCLLPLLVQDEWRKAEYSESDLQQPDHQNLFLHFPPEAAGRSAVHPLLSRQKYRLPIHKHGTLPRRMLLQSAASFPVHERSLLRFSAALHRFGLSVPAPFCFRSPSRPLFS